MKLVAYTGVDGWAPRPGLLAVPTVTAHSSTAGVGLPTTVLLYNGPVLCGFNVHYVPIKRLKFKLNCGVTVVLRQASIDCWLLAMIIIIKCRVRNVVRFKLGLVVAQENALKLSHSNLPAEIISQEKPWCCCIIKNCIFWRLSKCVGIDNCFQNLSA